MPHGFSAPMIDYLLYEHQSLRKEIESMLPCSSGVCMVPPRGARPGSPVEGVAIERAELSAILDAVARAIKVLPPDLKSVYVARYRHRLAISQVARVAHFSERSVHRKLSLLRAVVAGHLALQNGRSISRFWAWFEASGLDSVADRAQNRGGSDCLQKGQAMTKV